MTRYSMNLVCKAAFVEKYFKELEESKTEKNYTRFLHAAIHSERASHVQQAIEMIRANLASNEGKKGDLYHMLGVGLYRIGDSEGAKKALEECLKVDKTIWEASSLLENMESSLREPKKTSKSTLLRHVAAGGLGLGVGFTCGFFSKSITLMHLALAGGLAAGTACTMMFTTEQIIEFAGSVKKAGELGERIEKMTGTSKDSGPTDGNMASVGVAGACAGIVGAAFIVGLKKASSG